MLVSSVPMSERKCVKGYIFKLGSDAFIMFTNGLDFAFLVRIWRILMDILNVLFYGELMVAKTKRHCSLRERLRTHKVFTKRPVFYLNYHKFSIKSYVLDVY